MRYSWPFVGFIVIIFVDVLGPLLFLGTSNPPSESQSKAFVSGLTWQTPAKAPRAAIRDRTARSVLEMANLLLISAAVAVIAHNVFSIFRLSKRVTTDQITAMMSLAVITAALCYIVIDSPWNLFWTESIPFQLFRHACELTGSTRLMTASWATILLVQVTMVVVTLTISLLIADESTELAMLEEQSRQLRILLFQAAGVLVLYSIEAGSEILWPSALLPMGDGKAPNDAEFVQKLALGVSMSAGIYNSLLLAAIAGPAIWIVTTRVKSGLETIGDETERNKFAEAHHLLNSPSKYLTNLATVVSPLIAGIPITKLLAYLVT